MIHGRDAERGTIAARVDGLRSGHGFALLVSGPAGIGKSALLDEAVAAAAPLRVLRACGYESETEIPFGGLLGVLTPLLDLRAGLPAAQRHALEAALALSEPAPYDPFALRVAVASLLAAAAEEDPLLVAVDDAHWLDEVSLHALLFAARRPAGDGVGLLIASRDEGAAVASTDLERLDVAPLDAEAARRVLGEADGLTAPVADVVLRAAAGNPLALRELPRALTPAQRRGEESLDAPLRAEGPLVEAFVRQVAQLPDAEQLALCVVAAAGGGTPDDVAAALRALQIDEAVLISLAERGLVTADGATHRLRHPLLGSAAYHARSSAERRAVHRALAADAAPARRAWHLAHSATGPDGDVAEAVEEAAGAARARGGHAESARTYVRAAELSPDPAAATRRRLEAAGDFALAGHGSRAFELAEAVAGGADDVAVRAAATRLRAHLLMRSGNPAAALEALERLAAEASAAGDREGAAAMLLEASMTHMFGGDMQALLDSAERVRRQSAGVSAELELVATLVAGEALVALGRGPEGDRMIAAAEPLLLDADPLSPIAEVIGMGAMASMWIERFDRAERALDGLVRRAREAGAAGRLPYPLAVRSQLRWRRGRWPAALGDAHEAVELARDTGQAGMLAVALPALARAEAGRGRIDDARRHGEEGLELAEDAAGDATAVHSLAALGFVELTDGRPGAAATWLDRAAELTQRHEHGEPALTLFAGDHVEALARAGRRDDAEAALARLEEAATRTGGAWAAAVAARGRVLLRPGDEVDEHAAAALDAHDRVDMPFERGRTQLAIGERLRRERRRGAAREPLRAAAAHFERLGAAPWSRRARLELEIGEIRSAPAEGALERLTPNELQIALLVGEGSSNADAAAALFVSRKTIEHHLTSIYRKLDLRSRTQLAALVAEEAAGSG